MANNENLIPIRTKNEAREKGKNGGKKSGIKRRELKTMKSMLDYLLSKEVKNHAGKNITNLEALMIVTLNKALDGDIKAVQFIRDTIGEMPTIKQDIKQNQPMIIEVANEEDKKLLERIAAVNPNQPILIDDVILEK